MRYLLDTSALIHLQRNHPALAARVASLPATAQLYASVIAQGELLYGALRAPARRRTTLAAEAGRLLADLADVLPVTTAVADRYARIKAQLAAQGTPIPANDIWVAAIALEAGLILVSDDAHFQNVPDLTVENWLTLPNSA